MKEVIEFIKSNYPKAILMRGSNGMLGIHDRHLVYYDNDIELMYDSRMHLLEVHTDERNFKEIMKGIKGTNNI